MNKYLLFFMIALFVSPSVYAARTVNSATVDGGASTSVTAGDTISTAVNVTTTGSGGNNDWKATGWRLSTSPSGAFTCNNHADVTDPSTTTAIFDSTAPTTDDTYNLYLIAYQNDNCTGGSSSVFVIPNAVTVTGGAAAELLCSSETSNAVINEIQTEDNFIELYLLNSTDILNWALYVDSTKIATLGTGTCEINGTAAFDNSGSGATNTTFPAGTYITCDHNVNPSNDEILLVDTNGSFSNGDTVVIDYIGYGNLSPSAIWQVNSSCGTLYPGHAADNKDIARVPDGTGDLEDNDDNSTKGTSNEPPVIAVDHYEIYHDGAGITCLSEEFTIKACENADCSTLVSEDVTATLNLGALGQPITISGGTLTTNVNYTTAGTIAVSLDNFSEPAAVSCFINNISDANCEMTFQDSGFVMTVPTLTACKPDATATIQAVQTSDQNNTCAAAFTGAQTVNFWSDYISPATGSNSVEIESTAIASGASGTGISLTFDSDGLATFAVQYDDAGQLQLNAEHTLLSGLSLAGDVTFVSKPVALVVYSDDANASCASNDASCSRFRKAGDSFSLKVNAACWTDDVDADYTDNPTTANFELTSIVNTSSVIAPATGSNGSLSVSSFNFATADAGTHTITQAISEVGVFSFGLTPPSYFSESLTTISSPAIGRFYPDHFKVTNTVNGSLADACTGFSYSGQDINYQTTPELTVTAYNAASPEVITQNYTGDFAKLTANDFTLTNPTTDASQLGADATNLVNLTRTAGTATLTDNADGSITYTFGGDDYQYLHETNSKISPFNSDIDLIFTDITDSDSVATQSLPATIEPIGTSLRFGRLTIENAHGSELAPLPVTVKTDYFSSVDWVDNTADQCTSLTSSTHIRLANPETAGGVWQLANAVMTIASGNTSTTFSNNSPFVSGSALLTFSAPGEDNQGYVDIASQLTTDHNWLLDDRDNDGNYDDEATARASFGLFSGSDTIIFRRELY